MDRTGRVGNDNNDNTTVTSAVVSAVSERCELGCGVLVRGRVAPWLSSKNAVSERQKRSLRVAFRSLSIYCCLVLTAVRL